jgi:hypothetical protein
VRGVLETVWRAPGLIDCHSSSASAVTASYYDLALWARTKKKEFKEFEELREFKEAVERTPPVRPTL